MSLALHMRCSLAEIAACSNSVCKKITFGAMHETAQRLLTVGMAKGAKTFVEIARALGASDQSATNWKARGVPSDVMIRAAALYRVDAVWLATGSKDRAPEPLAADYPQMWIRPGTAGVEEKRQRYLSNDDEQRLIEGFRVADDSLRRSMLLLAVDSLERFGRPRPPTPRPAVGRRVPLSPANIPVRPRTWCAAPALATLSTISCPFAPAVRIGPRTCSGRPARTGCRKTVMSGGSVGL